jgi:anti-sigma factor ChrR (cupin superfamily)
VEPESLQPQTYPRIEIQNLFRIAEWQDTIPWQVLEESVEIHRLYGDGITGPTATLIRMRKGGKVPPHTHTGYEHIVVLSGSQRDQNSIASEGTLMINPPGTAHTVESEAGCIVLAFYEKPVQFAPKVVQEQAPISNPP